MQRLQLLQNILRREDGSLPDREKRGMGRLRRGVTHEEDITFVVLNCLPSRTLFPFSAGRLVYPKVFLFPGPFRSPLGGSLSSMNRT